MSCVTDVLRLSWGKGQWFLCCLQQANIFHFISAQFRSCQNTNNYWIKRNNAFRQCKQHQSNIFIGPIVWNTVVCVLCVCNGECLMVTCISQSLNGNVLNKAFFILLLSLRECHLCSLIFVQLVTLRTNLITIDSRVRRIKLSPTLYCKGLMRPNDRHTQYPLTQTSPVPLPFQCVFQCHHFLMLVQPVSMMCTVASCMYGIVVQWYNWPSFFFAFALSYQLCCVVLLGAVFFYSFTLIRSLTIADCY